MPIDLIDREKIAKWREAAGLSVADAAKAAGMSRQHWYSVENGTMDNPTIGTLDSMAKVFKKKLKDLLK